MFQAYWNSTLRESIRTQAEEDMVRDVLAIDTLTKWNEAYAAFRLTCLNKKFRASHERIVVEKALMVRQRELAYVPQHIEDAGCCAGGPLPQSFLGSLFTGIMSDFYAYQHIDPNSNELPSQQYFREKAVGSVIWDLFGGRR
jgi:hypothetical protein